MADEPDFDEPDLFKREPPYHQAPKARQPEPEGGGWTVESLRELSDLALEMEMDATRRRIEDEDLLWQL